MTVSNKKLQQNYRLAAHRIVALRLAILGGLCMVSLGLPSLLYHPRPNSSDTTAPLTSIDSSLQVIASTTLRTAVIRTDAERGGVLVLDAGSGAIKAMATANGWGNGRYARNIITDAPWEPGSVMKPLTIAVALNEHAISLQTSFYDTGQTYVDGFRITNATTTQPRTITAQNIITDSINTGTVNVLRQLGGGNINIWARQKLYSYFTTRYHFGRGEVAGMQTGALPSPIAGEKLGLVYANMAFGQDMTLTPLQLASAYAAILNGGTYYAPLMNSTTPNVLSQNIISRHTSDQVRQLLQTALATNNKGALRVGYVMGGKSGTAHVATPSGEYVNSHRDNGTYIGFVARGTHMYILLVRLDEPKTPEHTFASTLAKEVWAHIVTTEIDSTGSFVN